MLLFFLLSGNLGTVLTFAGLVLGLWVFAYCFAHIPPKMRCYEGDTLKKRMYLPNNKKFYGLMMKMKNNDRFEIFVNREDTSHWGNRLFLMMISEDVAKRESVENDYSLDCLALQKRLYRITHIGTGKRWVLQSEDTDLYKVKYTLHCGE